MLPGAVSAAADREQTDKQSQKEQRMLSRLIAKKKEKDVLNSDDRGGDNEAF